VEPAADATVFVADGDAFVLRAGRQTRVRMRDFSAASAGGSGGDGIIRAPMHGRVLQLFAAAGQNVSRGQPLAVIEAMKMEHTLQAPFAGTVQRVTVSLGAQVVEGGEIMVIEPAEAR
jgi:3-methylcrotonyl-CoA carboxylase alpha subunit